jgi:hypothetical protein
MVKMNDERSCGMRILGFLSKMLNELVRASPTSNPFADITPKHPTAS